MLWLQQLPIAFFGLHVYAVVCMHTCVYMYVFVSNYEMTQWKLPILKIFISFPSFSTAFQLSTLAVCSKEQDNSPLRPISKISQAGFSMMVSAAAARAVWMSLHVVGSETLISGSGARNVRVCLIFTGDLPKKSMYLPTVLWTGWALPCSCFSFYFSAWGALSCEMELSGFVLMADCNLILNYLLPSLSQVNRTHMHFLHNKFDCLEEQRLVIKLTAVDKNGP